MTNDYITHADAAELLTRAAAAEMLGVNPSMVSAYVKQGKLKGAFKLGQAWAIPKTSVEELAKARPEGGFKRGRKSVPR